jgi:type I restriction enzyme S subunit
MKFVNKLLSEVAFFQEGPGVRKTQFRSSGVKLLNVGNINNDILDTSTTKLYISEEEAFGNYKHFLVDEGDLLIASSGIVVTNFHNKIAFATKKDLPLCLNTSTIRFKSLNKSEFSINYFRFYLKTNHFKNQLKKLITGAAQLNFGPSHLKKIIIPIPSLSDQNRITELLSKSETLIEQRKQSISLLDEFLKSTFVDMFGDPVKNEKGWENVRFGDYILKIIAGSSYGGEQKDRLMDDEYGVLKVSAVTWGVFNPNEFKVVNIKDITSKLIHPQKGDLLFSRANTKELVGATCIVDKDYPKLFLPDKIWNLKLNENELNHYFIHFLFQNASFRHTLTKGATGTSGSMLNISMPKLRNIQFSKPPIELQTKFAEIVAKTEALKEQYKTSLHELENLYGSLSQQAFKGEM